MIVNLSVFIFFKIYLEYKNKKKNFIFKKIQDANYEYFIEIKTIQLFHYWETIFSEIHCIF